MSKKKVLVIGGTGIAGQFITDYLLHYHDICEVRDIDIPNIFNFRLN